MLKFLFVYMRYLNALIIRIFLIVFTEILLKYDITYTDIDYHVFNDGAKHLLSLESPYNRETYRYTPLLAFLVVPNHIININFGKLVFVCVDLLNGICIEILLNLQNFYRKKKFEDKQKKRMRKIEKKEKKENILNTNNGNVERTPNDNSLLDERINSNSSNSFEGSVKSFNDSKISIEGDNKNDEIMSKIMDVFGILKKIMDNPFASTSLFYLYNPFVINISTRGSADCLIIFFILLTLIFIELELFSIAGIFYGLSIHFKIYPIIYAPAIFLYIITKKYNLFFRDSFSEDETPEEDDTIKSDNLSKNKNSNYGILQFFFKFFTIEYYINLCLNILTNFRNIVSSLIRQFRGLFYFVFKYVLNLNAITFFGLMFITFSSLFFIFYVLFGQKFVYEYLLYHVVRKDHRHNYSLFSYLMYLIYTTHFGKILSLLAFLPQVILILFTSIFLYNDLNVCLITITWIFVTFNKVVTAQYYLWYISLIPLIMPFNKMFTEKKIKCTILFSLWLYFEIYWNSLSHNLEFKGYNLFMEIWILNIVFFIINCIIIEEIISDNISKKEIK